MWPLVDSNNNYLAYPDGGRWILRTYAMKAYGLAATDLDSILPITIEHNRYGGPHKERKYNEHDVEVLAWHLNAVLYTDTSSGAPLAPANGASIMRTDAMSEFNLKSCQMDRIMPIEIITNMNSMGRTWFTRYYNRCDVAALHNEIQDAIANPTCNGQPIPVHRANTIAYGSDVESEELDVDFEL